MVSDSLKWCTVSLSEVISRGKRIEASVYDVEAKKARELIANGKYTLSTIGGKDGYCDSYTCGRFKRIWLEQSDYPIYQPSSINEIYPRPDGYLSKETKVDMDALRVKKGQILLTCSGTIGKVGLVADSLDNQIFSHDLLRVSCRDSEDIGYVYTYLKSKTGNKILLTNSYGAVITHIEAEHLETVPIPDAPKAIKLKIGKAVNESYALRDESNKLIDKAKELLIGELALPPLSSFKDHKESEGFECSLSNLRLRFDASYHVPIVDRIEKCLMDNADEVIPLGDARLSSDIILPGRFKRVYVDEGHGRVFIGGKQLWELDPYNKKYLSNVHHGELVKQKLELHENMTLITCSGTIGKVALVGKQWEGWAANQHIIRVVPSSIEFAGYINLFLDTEYGYHLIVKHTYGAVIDEIDDNHVAEIPIPLLKDKKKQKEINDLVLKASELRYQAYCLEQKALQILDDEVIFAS